MNQFPPGPLSIPLRPFGIFKQIRGNFCNFLFIAGVKDTRRYHSKEDVDEKFLSFSFFTRSFTSRFTGGTSLGKMPKVSFYFPFLK
jgi:hypothetical protein